MVRLTKIYTRTGDEGLTGLSNFSRVRKTDPRIEAYADVDEANSAIGMSLALAEAELSNEVRALLLRIQNELFDLGADLSTPMQISYEFEPIRVDDSWIARLEESIDEHNAKLETLDSFILPGGTRSASALHLARTIVRRAERATWHAIETHGTDPAKPGLASGGINVVAAKYLNRLSDLLFVLARTANHSQGGDVKWKPAPKS